ncbi:hypothetical protein TREMEDRAFT_65422 [Tremella mesenterica DSM 1558]|uniref:uncharacterized protein n=1 Tax=Tremella mesenterica (strain ATCC 24925 / CBS 8224 / DSM 1558 / NBRC 9311 / NRRL Y-6157 / RJB 2259-6 / UBC 559-6) TaxID=578456 RepID=UPI00032D1747|nr:uncharacterized protein TREMEDRAFT_65422 [Tremella mesenterica DSM 1558]EIW66553.1 hypothetical protein TREMEDRAFT_65422 [Tremella mesenterica DSM 1558]
MSTFHRFLINEISRLRLQGLSIFILLSLFLGIYLWNRHRHRVRRGPTRTIPSLLFTAPTNTDPYAEEPFSYTILPATQTTYSNQHDAEWELPLHTSTLRANRHLRGKRDDWAEAEVDSPGLTRREHEDYPFHSQVPRHLSSGGMITSPSDKEDPREGDRVMRETPWGPTRIENPFEGGDETMRLSPDMRSVSERDDGDSAEGSGSSLERSVRIGEKQGDGSRFVETFSTESLVSS